jgi:hypothetical protein
VDTGDPELDAEFKAHGVTVTDDYKTTVEMTVE